MSYVHGVRELAAAFDRIAAAAVHATTDAVAEGAHRIEAEAKRAAPVQTGSLRRSVRVDGPVQESLGVASAKIGPSMVYGRRVSRGFEGPDALGRIYHQKPNPYFENAFARVKPLLPAIFAKHWGAALHR